MDRDIYELINGTSGCESSASQIPEIMSRLDRNEELLRALVKFLSQGNGDQLPPIKGGKGKRSKREKKLAKQVKKLKKQNKKLVKHVKSNHRQPETPWLQAIFRECASKALGIALDEVSLRQKAKHALPPKAKRIIELPPADYKIT